MQLVRCEDASQLSLIAFLLLNAFEIFRQKSDLMSYVTCVSLLAFLSLYCFLLVIGVKEKEKKCSQTTTTKGTLMLHPLPLISSPVPAKISLASQPPHSQTYIYWDAAQSQKDPGSVVRLEANLGHKQS